MILAFQYCVCLPMPMTRRSPTFRCQCWPEHHAWSPLPLTSRYVMEAKTMHRWHDRIPHSGSHGWQSNDSSSHLRITDSSNWLDAAPYSLQILFLPIISPCKTTVTCFSPMHLMLLMFSSIIRDWFCWPPMLILMRIVFRTEWPRPHDREPHSLAITRPIHSQCGL